MAAEGVEFRLFEAVARGDQEAFGRLYDSYSGASMV
jgi:hypothetical protein